MSSGPEIEWSSTGSFLTLLPFQGIELGPLQNYQVPLSVVLLLEVLPDPSTWTFFCIQSGHGPGIPIHCGNSFHPTWRDPRCPHTAPLLLPCLNSYRKATSWKHLGSLLIYLRPLLCQWTIQNLGLLSAYGLWEEARASLSQQRWQLERAENQCSMGRGAQGVDEVSEIAALTQG
ncbi:hypothetical protein SKAU_G00155890 [Synaphobranchus kaupii]|uniref:Uncharacterized protein n=1 Tax=Synaphobranchus kaupii TaxID=118154 RepID=A0A9Q1FHX0_SYNKA|nr:hypothetical protein SKAU_G00155890 [Synaphobranchus kaupii]